jgi:hypothetical protein
MSYKQININFAGQQCCWVTFYLKKGPMEAVYFSDSMLNGINSASTSAVHVPTKLVLFMAEN